MSEFKIELGGKVTDYVTGFSGIVTARVEYINGCRQYCVTPKAVKNELAEGKYFDEDRLLAKPAVKKNAGGPQADAPPIG